MPSSIHVRITRFRILATVYIGLIVLAGYLIAHHYQVQITAAEESTLARLYSISSTLAERVDKAAIKEVFNEFPLDGDTSGLHQNDTYKMYVDLFSRAAETNRLKTPIYTLSYDSVSDKFLGGIASNGSETYGWHYASPPKKLREFYLTGGMIPQFEDYHGTWLSAVYPIKDEKGQVFAVIEADYPFDSFIAEARAELRNGIIISLFVMLLVGTIIYPILNRVLTDEEKSKAALEAAKQKIQEKNEQVVSSLEYAKTIQESLLPEQRELQQFFSTCMAFLRPKDIVSGDFYWFHQLTENQAVVAVADCTGHGVPGALVAIMGNNYLNEIVVESGIVQPNEILELLDGKIKKTFAEKASQNKGTDGMDIGICYIDKSKNKIAFAGARRPLTVVTKNGSDKIEGERRGIGEHFLKTTQPFQKTGLDIDPTATYYLCSDGLQDQFGGPKSKKLMKKRLNEWYCALHDAPEDARETHLDKLLGDWKNECQQTDDICVFAFSV